MVDRVNSGAVNPRAGLGCGVNPARGLTRTGVDRTGVDRAVRRATRLADPYAPRPVRAHGYRLSYSRARLRRFALADSMAFQPHHATLKGPVSARELNSSEAVEISTEGYTLYTTRTTTTRNASWYYVHPDSDVTIVVRKPKNSSEQPRYYIWRSETRLANGCYRPQDLADARAVETEAVEDCSATAAPTAVRVTAVCRAPPTATVPSARAVSDGASTSAPAVAAKRATLAPPTFFLLDEADLRDAEDEDEAERSTN